MTRKDAAMRAMAIFLFFTLYTELTLIGQEILIDDLDDKLIMDDYSGHNQDRALKERRRNLAKLDGASIVRMRIRQWPDVISVYDPTDTDAVSELRDGDRGFIWQMTGRQISEMVLRVIAKRDSLTVEVDKKNENEIMAIKAWCEATGFKKLEIKIR